MASKQQPKHNIIVGLDAAQYGEDKSQILATALVGEWKNIVFYKISGN